MEKNRNTQKVLSVGQKNYSYFDLKVLDECGVGNTSRLPVSLKILLENLLRYNDGSPQAWADISFLANWNPKATEEREIAYYPARVLMQDFTGVPAVVDLAAMRNAMQSLKQDPSKINPLTQVDLVIDHSVSVDYFGTADAFAKNVALEYERNTERYAFLRWGQSAFKNFRVVPPGTGIVHQVNLEYLAQVVWTGEGKNGETMVYPDTLVGTDSHTTMVNGLAVLGWGVGGIEAEAAMLGQPISMLIPEVVGFKLKGELPEGTTATDLVLTVTQMLRKKGVVGKFVEFYGAGLKNLSLADRATLANMAPEYGATCGLFPIDQETINYLQLTARDSERIALVEKYARAQGMWWEEGAADPVFTDTLELDMSTVVPCLAGPKRPQDRIPLTNAASNFHAALESVYQEKDAKKESPVVGTNYKIKHGDVVIAAITSCTNTSNPSVMMAAGLVARKARARGLQAAPWVKTSLAPGSQVVTDYLNKSGLQSDLDALGFQLVGLGCTTCIGNSGPLPTAISEAIHAQNLVVSAVLSGNRNFEGRVNPDVMANYLASPPLVVAYAIAGNMGIDIMNGPLGKDQKGQDVFLKDIWPTQKEVNDIVNGTLTREMFQSRYRDVFKGTELWQKIKTSQGLTYQWDEHSTFIKNPPFFVGMKKEVTPRVQDVMGARPLLILGDSVTTDHISPAGNISAKGPAGQYLLDHGVTKQDFNSYGSRRGNHEVMMRGTFANIRIRNEMVPGVEGGVTKYIPSGEVLAVYDASMKYQESGTPLVVVAGKEYGTGSSRDWAAKGTTLLGIQAVIVESFERIHRSNLIGMGVLPLQFKEGVTRKTLALVGDETFDITGLSHGLQPKMMVNCTIKRDGKVLHSLELVCRIDTGEEVEYYRHGGILQYVLRRL